MRNIPVPEEERIRPFKIEKPPTPFSHRSKNIKSTKLTLLDVDEQYKKDKANGKAVDIYDENIYDNKDNLTQHGLNSPLFGPDTLTGSTDRNDYYRCKCGNPDMIGSIYEGDVCPKCGTVVEEIDDLSITGYIYLGGYKVITPSAYLLVERLIGKAKLPEMLKYNAKKAFDANGIRITQTDKKNPYKGIGMVEFEKRFDEILDYAVKQKKDKVGIYNLLKNDYRNAVFSSYVNPYNARLRPSPKDDSKMCQFKTNKLYNIILIDANIIKINVPDTIREGNLYEIQEKWNELFKIMRLEDLQTKDGLLRGKVTCARVSDCGRFIIIPGYDLKVDECILPYLPSVELFRPILVNKLVKLDGITHRKANDIVNDAKRKFDKRIWLLMNYIITNSSHKVKVTIQRSPSLVQESMRMLKIKAITADYYDLSLQLPVAILDGLNADFDGDQLSLILVYDKRLIASWTFFQSPRHHFISRYDGRYSGYCKFIKDTIVILSEIWEMGKNLAYYEQWASEKEYNEYINSLEDDI